MRLQNFLMCLFIITAAFSLSAQQYNYGPRETKGFLPSSIPEASGMAPSFKHSNSFWVHNDGGASNNKLYLYDYDSKTVTKTVTITNEENRDWEAMASFEYGGTSYLAIGATGKNSSGGKRRQIIIVEEPGTNNSVSKHKRIVLKDPPSGLKDIEAIAVAPLANKVIMLEKNGNIYTGKSRIYSFDLNMNNTTTVDLDLGDPSIKTDEMVLRVTGMDISKDEKRIIIIGYKNDQDDNDLREYTVNSGQTIKDALQNNIPRKIDLESNKGYQYESVCYDNEGKDIYYTYETSGANVYKFSAIENNPAPNNDYFFEVESLTDWSSSGSISLNGDKEVGDYSIRGNSFSSEVEYKKEISNGKNAGIVHNNGKLKFWYKANDVVSQNKSDQIRVEIRSVGGDDNNEYQWTLTDVVSGWKEYTLDLDDSALAGNVDLSNINYFRIYNSYGSFGRTTYLDAISFEANTPTSTVIIDDCESVSGWSSGNGTVILSGTKQEGDYSLEAEGTSVLEFKKEFSSINTGYTVNNGVLKLDYYASEDLDDVHFEISSETGANVDNEDLEWVQDISQGWNAISVPLNDPNVIGSGNIDLNAIKSFRIFNTTENGNNRITRVDHIRIEPVGASGLVQSDIIGKLITGYQGWFSAQGGQSPDNNWRHWSNKTIPNQNNVSFELWPDVREYDEGSLFQTGFADLGNGQPAKLFSSYSDNVVDTHFRWMEEYGIDVAALQRFGSEFGDPNVKAHRDGMAVKMKNAAQTYNRKFYIMYDISSWNNFQTEIKDDWDNVITNPNGLNLTASPAYAKEEGKPVVCIWGFGEVGRPGDANSYTDVINYFKSKGCYVILGLWKEWRTQTDLLDSYKLADMVSPWFVGSFGNGDVSSWGDKINADMIYCKSNDLDYLPVLWPGFGWSNLKANAAPNHIPRNHGDFMWDQFYTTKTKFDANQMPASAYVAMFDEYDEGTAIAKAAEDSSMAPTDQYFLTLDADGVHVSSDFYLRLTGNGARMLKGELPLTNDHESSTPHTLGALTNGAEFVSYSGVPSQMEPGATATVSVIMRNTGTSTWTSTDSYKLGSFNDDDAFGFNRVVLATGDAIAPNQEKTFTFTITAPQTTGDYNFQWKMVQDGVEWFGTESPLQTISVQPSTNAASFVSIQSLPSVLNPGETATVSVTVKNTGNTTWTKADLFKLGSVNDDDSFGFNRVLLDDDDAIAPNQEKTFTFTITAPQTTGDYNFQWKMVQDSADWFGAESTLQTVTVANPVNGAIYVSQQSGPSTMTPGQTATVSVTMKNTGTTTWTNSNLYKLGSFNDNNDFGLVRVELGASEAIAPNQEKTFSFTIMAPTTPGAYNFQWRMVQDNVEWFGTESTLQTINVASLYMDECDSLDGWSTSGGNALTLSTTFVQGTGSVKTAGSGTNEFYKVYQTPYISGVTEANGMLKFSYFAGDADLDGVRVELGSGGAADIDEYQWTLTGLVHGWNTVELDLSAASKSGTPNLNALNWFRIYNSKSVSIVTRVDGIQVMNGTSSSKASKKKVNKDVVMTTIYVYPNPVHDYFDIDLKGYMAKDLQIKLYDITGRVIIDRAVLGANKSVFRIDANQLSSGMHILQVVIDGEIHTRKLTMN